MKTGSKKMKRTKNKPKRAEYTNIQIIAIGSKGNKNRRNFNKLKKLRKKSAHSFLHYQVDLINQSPKTNILMKNMISATRMNKIVTMMTNFQKEIPKDNNHLKMAHITMINQIILQMKRNKPTN